MDNDYIEYFTDSGDRITGLEAEIYIAADKYKNNNKGLRKSSSLYQKDAFIHGAKWMLNYLKSTNQLKEKFENTNNKTITRIEFFKKYCRNCSDLHCEGVDYASPTCKFYGEFNITDELSKKSIKQKQEEAERLATIYGDWKHAPKLNKKGEWYFPTK